VRETRSFKRALLGISDPALRIEWLHDKLDRWPLDDSAQLLDAVLAESEIGDPAAREALFTIALLAVTERSRAIIEQLRRTARAQGLLSLGRLLRTGPQPHAQVVEPDKLPVPAYSADRELSLGERRSLARKPARTHFEKLLLDPHPMVTRLLLDNPRMTEEDALRIATLRPARPLALRELARSHRWLRRARVRMAILLNPGSPPELAMPLLGLCTRSQLAELYSTVSVSMQLRSTAVELLQLRPPLPRAAQRRQRSAGDRIVH